MKFTVLMTTYFGEIPSNLEASLRSILIEQTLLPTQVVLVLDGPIKTECVSVIEKYQKQFPEVLDVISCRENQGQSKASAEGLKYVKYDILARMDSDDISVSDRFEKEVEIMQQHPEIDVVGGWIEEFALVIGDLKRLRIVPEMDNDIKRAFSKRTPINNVTAMIRKEALIAAGGYGRDTVNEDYSLYAHMWVKGCHFYNIQSVLVNVRVGNGMTTRRADFRICSDWCKDQYYLYRNKKESFSVMLASCIKCFGFVIMPNKIKDFLYTHILRKSDTNV